MTAGKLLLVEDDDHLGFLVEDQLSSNDYDVTWVKNGEIAWQKFDNGNFDLCLLDILLPGMDGIELAKKIKNKNRKIPVIFITSRSLKSDIITGFDVGCDDYIVKPFEVYQSRTGDLGAAEVELHFRAVVISLDRLFRFLQFGDRYPTPLGRETPVVPPRCCEHLRSRWSRCEPVG